MNLDQAGRKSGIGGGFLEIALIWMVNVDALAPASSALRVDLRSIYPGCSHSHVNVASFAPTHVALRAALQAVYPASARWHVF